MGDGPIFPCGANFPRVSRETGKSVGKYVFN